MLKIFDNLRLIRENKDLQKEVRVLKATLQKKDKEIERLTQDINEVRGDFIRALKNNTIQIKTDDDGKVIEWVKYTPDYFLIEKESK